MSYELDKMLEKQKLKYEEKKNKAIAKAEEYRLKKEIRDIKNANKDNSWKEKWTTSKKLMYIIIINCTIIEIYTMWAMYKLQDLSALSTLITAIIGEGFSYMIYCAKSFFAKKNEVLMAFEREKYQNTLNDDCDTDSENEETNEEEEV